MLRLANLWNDFRYAARRLRASPGFAAAAIVTIALGVGVNTAIFSVLNGVALSGLPVPDANELVGIHQILDEATLRRRLRAGPESSFSTPEYEAYRDSARTLSGVIGYSRPVPATVDGDVLEQTVGALVTCNYFDVLRQPPVRGRGLSGDCATPGAARTIVIGHDLWTTAFGGDAEIVGREVRLNGEALTVVGVAPEGMRGVDMAAVSWFAPISAQPLLFPVGADVYRDENWSWLSLIGRKAGDATLADVRAELGVIAARIDGQQPPRETTLDVARASRLSAPEARRQSLPVAAVIGTAFGLVLLIACANVANLLLARAAARTHEIAVRMSLGASRARVVQQLLAESGLLALIGGALGAMLAMSTAKSLFALVLSAPGTPELTLDAVFDVRVLAFAFAVTLASGVLFGLAPALKASKPDLHTATKADRGAAGHLSGSRLQRVLLGLQVAVCMVLMIAAGLLLRGLYATQTVDPGFAYENVAVASFDFARAGYDAARDRPRAGAVLRQVAERVEALPGIDAAALAQFTPLLPGGGGFTVRVPGLSEPVPLRFNMVSPDYFSTLRIPIVRGETFAGFELSEVAGTVIVTEATARRLWPDRDPVGQTFTFWNPAAAAANAPPPEYRVVGVARDAQVTEIGRVPSDYVYLPAGPAALLQLVARSRVDFAATAAAIRTAAAELDPALIVRVDPLEGNLEFWRGQARVVSTLSLSLGALALGLAAVGVYGVVAFAVNRRVREIGVRMALGANARSVLALMLRRTLWPVAVGALAGVAVTAAVSGVLSSVLFGVSPLDPVGMGAAAIFVVGVAIAAAVLAARPAMRSDPLVTLRYE